MEKIFFGLILLTISLKSSDLAAIKSTRTTCGYESCHPLKEGLINVHLVPHTHDDVGWLKTVDQYYYGSNSSIQRAGVQYILDSVINELRQDSKRRFIYVETAFFWKWWIQQHDAIKHEVRKFVNNGQLEFIGGAWSMNDEATTHYHSIIDQFTWGLRKLNDSFGDCGRPKIGWQIDPFGHSREMASIFAQLGFDGLLLGRIDYQDKDTRFKSKTAEMIWQGSSSLGASSNIFTGVMYNTYGPPPGFCWDLMCNDEQLVDDKKSPLYNIDRKVDDFFAYLDKVSQVYTTNNIILTMGEDFHYQNAHTWFKNLDKLIYFGNQRQNSGSKYNLIYSTPSCYVKAVHDAQVKFPEKSDDFFPYASDPHAYWTGYFVSRPTLKRFEREGNNFLQVCKQLYALTDLGPEDAVDLNALREAMGVMQHHDAVTGTEKQHVADDYARILQNGFDECAIITDIALSKLTKKSESIRDELPTYQSCLLTNISSCPLSEHEEKFVVTVYNPLSRPVHKYVRLPVLGTAYEVTDLNDGSKYDTEIIPIAEGILNIPGRTSAAKVELIFAVQDLPPLGFKSIYIERVSGDRVLKPSKQVGKIKGDTIGFTLDENGFLAAVEMNQVQLPVTQNFYYYHGFVGDNNVFENRSSGAYIFRPTSENPIPVAAIVNTNLYRGLLISEVHQTFNDWVTQIIRIYNNENYVEFDWVIGPIPRNETHGKEVITKFNTDLGTEGIFYTDSNGREMLKRQRNYRPTWELNVTEFISGNYYPITSKITLVDAQKNIKLSVLNDRAQGGSSLSEGSLEIMVHRNCLHDDAFGVGEALNESAYGEGLVARGSHYLIVGPVTSTEEPSTAAFEHDLAQRKLLSAWTFISSAENQSFEEYQASHIGQFSGLTRALPSNVQILTLEPWKGMSFLLRLEHVLEKSEVNQSELVVVNLKGLFTPFEILSINETTLAANQWLGDNNRLQFNSQTLKSSISKKDSPWKMVYSKNKRATVFEAVDDSLEITLEPMQIRTFVIEIQKR